jgi:hypothetical protein
MVATVDTGDKLSPGSSLLLLAINYCCCRCYQLLIITVATTPEIICHRCHGIDENLRQGLISGVNDTGH